MLSQVTANNVGDVFETQCIMTKATVLRCAGTVSVCGGVVLAGGWVRIIETKIIVAMSACGS